MLLKMKVEDMLLEVSYIHQVLLIYQQMIFENTFLFIYHLLLKQYNINIINTVHVEMQFLVNLYISV